MFKPDHCENFCYKELMPNPSNISQDEVSKQDLTSTSGSTEIKLEQNQIRVLKKEPNNSSGDEMLKKI